MKKIVDIEGLLIAPSDNVRSAMEKLDKSGSKILFVADSEKKIMGSISDGDIRRFVLSGGKVEENVVKAANQNCYCLNVDEAISEDFFEKKKITCVPVVDKRKRIVFFWFSDSTATFPIRKKIDLPVVIQAGGFGTRLYPYTQILPKALVPIGEKPITELIIDSFLEYGCTEFFMIVNHKKNMIKSYFAEIEKNYSLTFIDEDTPLGTAGGLSLLKGKINKPFFLTNCDTLIDVEYSDVYKMHNEKNAVATVVSAMKNYVVPYGVMNINKSGGIQRFIEKPSHDYIVNTGLYLMNQEIIEGMTPNQRISVPEVLQNNMNQGRVVAVYPVTENCWNDMGQPDELKKMQTKFKKRGSL